MSYLSSSFFKVLSAYRYSKLRAFIKDPFHQVPAIVRHPHSTKWLWRWSPLMVDLRELWRVIKTSVISSEHGLFWTTYAKLPIPYQLAALVMYTRVQPLRPTDYFYSDHMAMDHSSLGSFGTQPRLWLSEDMIEWDVPLDFVWHWVHSVMFDDKGVLLNETATYLLAGYSYEALLSQYDKHVKASSQGGPFFCMLLLALTFRMSFVSYAQEFAVEQYKWLALFKTWGLEHRIYVLKALRMSDMPSAKEYCTAWAPVLFPEAELSLALYAGSSKHPADVILAWYASNLDDALPTSEVTDLFISV